MTERIRFVEFERGEINLQTGEFPMILATDGEATDGDILSIEGAEFGSRAPLQLSHINDPRSTAGSVSGFRRDLQSTPKKLKAKGQIELGGEGPAADIRRDVAYMVAQGHVTGISVRWDPLESTRRVNLPADHFAYVDDEKEKDWRKRYGYFFKKWRVLEGSIVAVQADKESMIGRAVETDGHVAAFWRAMANDAQEPEKILDLRTEPPEEDPAKSKTVPMVAVVSPPTSESLRAAFAAQVREMVSLGISVEELAEVIGEQGGTANHQAARLAAGIIQSQTKELTAMRTELFETMSTELAAMRSQLAALEKDRVHGAQVPPYRTVADIMNSLESMLEVRGRKAIAAANALIEMKLGKVSPQAQTYRDIAHAEADALLVKAREAELDSIYSVSATQDPDASRAEAASLGSLLKRMENMIEVAKKRLTSEGKSDE